MGSEIKNALNTSYVIIMALVLLMMIDFVGVVAPEMLGKSFIMDMLAPLAFQYATSVRCAFVIASIIIFLVSPASDLIEDNLARNLPRKIGLAVIFIQSAFFIAYVHRFGYTVFVFLYPVEFLTFNVTGFIVANMFKTKRQLLTRNFGFEKVTILVENPTSFNWHSKNDGYINVENIFRGILILGGAGAGKTFTLIEEIIDMAIQKGFTGLIYDFKMNANFSDRRDEWSLTRHAYKAFIKSGSKQAHKNLDGKWPHPQSLDHDRRMLWVINWRNPKYSHQVNPIHPVYMESQSFANEYALTLLQNLKPEWIKTRDFFADSAIIYLKAIFWFLRCQFPESCTLPHAVTIALMSHSKVLAMLSLDKQCHEIVSSLLVAEQKNAEAQLAGAVASLQIPVDKVNSPEIFWVLSGNDFSLRLNDPESPGILALGNDPELKETYGPVAALIATVCKKVMNRPSMLPSIYLLDECPTLAIPNLSELPATGRSNKICTIVCGQDKSQFVVNYGKEQTDTLIANLGTHFYGQLNDLDTAKMASEVIGTREKENRSINQGKSLGESLSRNSGENIAVQRENLIHPFELQTLPRGRFVGKVAETSEVTPYSPFFNVRPDVIKVDFDHHFSPLLKKNEREELTDEAMNALMLKNYEQIKKDAWKLVDHCARAACLSGKADETKVFREHFYQGKRIVSTLGEPMVAGIEVDPETGIVTGQPKFDEDMTDL